MKQLYFYYQMQIEFDQEIRKHAFTLRVRPQQLPQQQIEGLEYRILPGRIWGVQQDCFGNTLWLGHYDRQHTEIRFEMWGLALIDGSKQWLEPCNRIFYYPSAYCQPSSELVSLGKQASGQGALAQACSLMKLLYGRFRYVTGLTSVQTTAAEAYRQRGGVCQDYAHLLLTLCRQQGIAARYVTGLLVGEGASHAWVEIYDGKYWIGLDPTHNRPVDDDYIKIAHGRDYGDCQINRGVFYGLAQQEQRIYVNVEEQ